MKAEHDTGLGIALRRAVWILGALASSACGGEYTGQPGEEWSDEMNADGFDVEGESQSAPFQADGIAGDTPSDEEVVIEEVEAQPIDEAVPTHKKVSPSCITLKMGGPTSCKSYSTWHAYTKKDCSARGMNLDMVWPDVVCAGGGYRYAKYRCCPR